MSKTASLGGVSGQAIVPFWNRVPLFFLFPLHPSMIGKVFLLCLFPALGIYATSLQTMVIAVGLLSLLAWIGFLRFGSRVLSETSLGHLSPRQYSQQADESLAYMPFKIFGLFFFFGLVVGILGGLFGSKVAIGANFAVSLFYPAALTVLVVSRSLSSGLHPGASIGVMHAIGKPYLLLCLFLFSLSTAQAFLSTQLVTSAITSLSVKWVELQTAAQAVQSQKEADAVGELFNAFNAELTRLKPRFAGIVFLVNAVAMYFMLIAFNMMGYVAYQYHAQLGLEVDDAPTTRRGGGAQSDADPESKQIAELIASGQIEQALDIAYEAQRLDYENIAAQERYHKLLHLAGKTDRLVGQTDRILPLLLKQGKKRNALEALRRCRQQSPQYRPQQPEMVLELAEAARSEREPKLALELLDGFEQKYPRSTLIPDAYFMSGRILCEDLRQDAKADEFFTILCERYSTHPRAGEAQKFRDVLARMQGNAGKA